MTSSRELLSDLWKWLSKSLGFKRLATSLLLALVGLAQSVESLRAHLPLINELLAGLGSGALLHSAVAGTLGTLKIGSLASLYSVVMGLVSFTPALWPFLPVLHLLGIALGSAGVGEALGKADVIADPTPTAIMALKAQNVSAEEYLRQQSLR